jgi:hypothetical protein
LNQGKTKLKEQNITPQSQSYTSFHLTNYNLVPKTLTISITILAKFEAVGDGADALSLLLLLLLYLMAIHFVVVVVVDQMSLHSRPQMEVQS